MAALTIVAIRDDFDGLCASRIVGGIVREIRDSPSREAGLDSPI